MRADTFAFLLYCASVAMAAPAAVKRASGTSYSGGTTASDVTDGVCSAYTFIWARGSTEVGTMGETVGPALAKKLIATFGADKMAIQGVDYPATIESNISMGSEGGPQMAQLAEQALKQCPTTKVIIGGYSQGATVTHYAVKQGGLAASDVAAATLFGDPLYGSAVGSLPTSEVYDVCAPGDGVCETHSFDITAGHLSYTTGDYVPNAATFVQKAVGGSSGTATSSGSTTGTSAAPATTTSAAAGLAGLMSSFGF